MNRGSFANTAILSLVTALALASTSHVAIARDLDGPGAIGNVESGQVPEAWVLRNGATLNVTGGDTFQVESFGSTVNMDGASVDASTGLNSGALTLRNGSVGTVANSTIFNATGRGLVLGNSGSSPGADLGAIANISNSSITGWQDGASVTSGGALNMSASQLIGLNDSGLNLFNGTARFTNGSTISGNANGVRISSDGSANDQGRTLTVDGSTVEGMSGPAILVQGSRNSTAVDITIQNGSKLISGNGNILEVSGNATADLTVDNSALVGDVLVEDGGFADLTLRNAARLTGNLTGVENLAVASGGTWHMVGDGGVTNLAMDGGGVAISDGSGSRFNTLTVGNLSGEGSFFMGTDVSAGTGDLLVVTGAASGDHLLHVTNTGAEPVNEDALKLVETAGGTAQFEVSGGAVDVGTFQYLLQQSGDDWFLVGTNQITPGTESVIGLHSTAPTVWYGEAASLRSRMGDLRLGSAETGAWARTYGRGYSVSSGAGQAYDQNQWGVSVGLDTPIAIDNGRLLVGVLGGYSQSDLDFDVGTTGKVDSYYAGVYATWLGKDGYYVDGLLKYNRFENSADVTMSDGGRAAGDYGNNGFGGQIEVGRTIALQNNWFVEPYAQLAAVRAGGEHYSLNNGMHADGDAMNSVLGRIGASVGWNYHTPSGGVVQPYLKLAVAQEFAKDNKVFVNGNAFNNDLSGTRGEVGFGVAAQLTNALQLHGDFDYANGKHIEQKWGVNVGLRYAF